jgi:uncharacterized lipoprotein YddW (UPF0748 family)
VARVNSDRHLRFIVAICLIGVAAWNVRAADDPTLHREVRALWVQRTSLTSPQAIETMVRSARASGFNTLIVQVRGRGDAYYQTTIEPRASLLAGQPSTFDPLGTTLNLAHKAGLTVHAWVNINLISSATELPADRSHLVYRHPEWLMVPRELADGLATMSPASPEYVGRLARWSRAASSQIEGLYASPISTAAADHVAAVVGDLAARYPVDGVHLDYVRYPNEDFDYSLASMAAFRAEMVRRISAPDRARLDEEQKLQSTTYADRFPTEWREFRQSRLNTLVMKLRTTLKARRPDVVLSAAVLPSADDAYKERLQDWQVWLDNGLIDILCPMAYTQDAGVFKTQVKAARQVAGLHPLWVGIGAFRLSPSQTVDNILAARGLGASGIILFSYDNLASPSRGSEYLSEVARAAFQ